MAGEFFGTSPEIDARKRYALSILNQGSDTSPKAGGALAAIARALTGGIGGYLANQAEQEDKAAGAAMFNGLPGLGGTPQASAAPVQPSAPATPMAGTGNYANAISGIESGGKYDLLGPVTKTGDRAYGKYQVMGANIPEWTKAALGQSMTPQQFLASPQAQDAVFNNRFGGYVSKYGPEGAARAWFAGEGGMNNPNARDQLGTTVADYARRFNAGLGQQQPYQVAGPAVAAPDNAPTQVAQASPAAPNRSQVQIPPEVAATIRQLGSDPRTRAQAWQLYMQYAKPVENIRPMTADERKQWQIPEGMSAGIDSVTGKPIFSPPQTNVNLNTAQKGQEVMATESAQDFKAAQAAGREAAKRTQVWDQMEQASKGFTPGALAETKLQAKRYLKDLGVISGEDVPDAEVFRQLQQQLAIHAQPKGQGAVSNFEREMYAKSIANMNMSPEALTRAIAIGRKLDDFDRKVAQIYRDNARKNGGVPDSISINEDIDKLGSPLGSADLNYLRRTGEKPASNTAPPAASGQPSQEEIIQELRRRGKL